MNTALIRAINWHDDAACNGTAVERFYPDGTSNRYRQQVEDAKTLCRRCPVVTACATWAITTGELWGIWGALDEGDRRRIRTQHPDIRTPQQIARIVETALTTALEPPEPPPLVAVFQERTEPMGDGHTRWLGAQTAISIRGRVFTPRRLAFTIGHGRAPDGTVRGTCGVAGCVTWDHLADGKIRRAQRIGVKVAA